MVQKKPESLKHPNNYWEVERQNRKAQRKSAAEVSEFVTRDFLIKDKLYKIRELWEHLTGNPKIHG